MGHKWAHSLSLMACSSLFITPPTRPWYPFLWALRNSLCGFFYLLFGYVFSLDLTNQFTLLCKCSFDFRPRPLYQARRLNISKKVSLLVIDIKKYHILALFCADLWILSYYSMRLQIFWPSCCQVAHHLCLWAFDDEHRTVNLYNAK